MLGQWNGLSFFCLRCNNFVHLITQYEYTTLIFVIMWLLTVRWQIGQFGIVVVSWLDNIVAQRHARLVLGCATILRNKVTFAPSWYISNNSG